MLLSVLLRTRDFGVGFWIDEGLSVGIADRPLSDIPAALRLDGSPPLYYALLHVWMAVFGSTEEATHALSLLCAVLAVPAAWWAARGLFGDDRRADRRAAGGDQPVPDALRAGDAHVRARGAARRARVRDVRPRLRARGHRRSRSRAPPGGAGRPRFAVALAALLYTHNWSLFFAAGCGLTWLVLLAAARGETRRELFLDGLIGFGGARPAVLAVAADARLPGPAHGRAVVVLARPRRPARGARAAARDGRPARPAAGRGRRRGRSCSTAARAASRRAGARCWRWAGCSWRRCSSPTRRRRSRPAWAARYLAVALPPLLLVIAGGLAHAGRLGLVGALVVALMWAGDGAPDAEEQRARDLGGDRAEPEAGRPRRLDPARADPGAQLLPAGGPALRDALGPGRRRRRDRLARRRRAHARDQRRAATSSR